jgi:predicted PhzF superfamily epimerase YddE/YHI9
MMARLHVLRVFTDGAGRFGNPLGVFLDGAAVPASGRQAIAADLGFSETVFVDDIASGRIRIFTPAVELPFAGHPCVGSAWLLAEQGKPVETLRPPAGEVRVARAAESTQIAARAEWCPPFELIELPSAAEVDRLDPADFPAQLAYCWAWTDEGGGWVRARSFPGEAGISEDEATGAAALMLTVELGRDLTIHQGLGSILRTRLLGDDWAEVGGCCALDEVRDYSLRAGG